MQPLVLQGDRTELQEGYLGKTQRSAGGGAASAKRSGKYGTRTLLMSNIVVAPVFVRQLRGKKACRGGACAAGRACGHARWATFERRALPHCRATHVAQAEKCANQVFSGGVECLHESVTPDRVLEDGFGVVRLCPVSSVHIDISCRNDLWNQAISTCWLFPWPVDNRWLCPRYGPR